MTAPALVQKLWNYCNILRDDGLSFRLRQGFDGQDGDYDEQLTFLLFLKMVDDLETHYRQARNSFARGDALRRLSLQLTRRVQMNTFFA